MKNKVHIYIALGIFGAMFLSLILYLIIFVNQNEMALLSNSYNRREKTLMKENLRGEILSSSGDVLAYSVENSDGSQTRIYPYGSLFAHVVGYSTNGKAGVEKDANYYLLTSGNSLGEEAYNASKNVLNDGNTVITTLDVDLQKIADDYLGSQDGAVIMTDVKTGKILAMVSHPDYDPNTISDNWSSYVDDENSSVLLNRVTQGLYPPGSTFKIITALEYYRENEDDYKFYEFDCNGAYTYGGYTISCYHGGAHGLLDFTGSFAKSCNSSFANIGMSLNRKDFSSSLDELLFNENLTEKMGLDFDTAVSTVNVSKSVEDYKMIQTCIGQGETSISPIHLNMITMAIANNGILMKPYVIDSVVNSYGKNIVKNESIEYGRLLSTDEAEFLTEIMMEVVLDGTATRLQSDLYEAAGKTGSAEYNSAGDSHAWFTGFAPCDDPEVAITIIIEGAGSGGEKAVPLAKLMFDSYFGRMEED